MKAIRGGEFIKLFKFSSTKCFNPKLFYYRYSSIVQNLIKFPAVFKLNPAIIKRTQAFWNLDNGRWETAIDELISPLSHEKRIKSWQREFLLTALLKQNANNLALRALRSPGNAISPMLEIKTLLANNLVAEALR